MKDSRIKYYLSILLVWTLLIVSIVFFEFYKIQVDTDYVAKTEARANFNKDQAIRLWADSHGGVYVLVDSLTQPNPALAHIPERDIQTPLGRNLTLMNPAYMVRQLNEYYAEYYNIVGHITSKKPLRAENKPDEWELNALNQFEEGIKEVSEYSDIDKQPFLRLMQPMTTKQSCLKCHAHQGYKVGDIRGGVSISIPMSPLLERAARHKQRNILLFSIIWIVGLIGISFSYKKIDNSLRKLEQAEQTLTVQNNKLDVKNQELIATQDKLLENEKKLSTLFEAMTDMVVLHEVVDNEAMEGVNCRIIDCNNSFAEMIGIKKEDVVGKLAGEIYHPDMSPNPEVYSKVALTGKSTQYTTYEQSMDKHFMVSMVSPKNGQFATVSTDITVIKQFQEIITAKNKELENYLYVASHDLRSPLVNIQGFSQLLKGNTDSIKNLLHDIQIEKEVKHQIDQIINEKIPQSLNFIFGSVSKMDYLIKGLLQLSRTGSVAMTIQQIDMNKLFEEVVRVNSFQINEIKGKIEADSLPACYGDKDLLNQLFSNIISNAIKYRKQSASLKISIGAEIKYNQVIYCIEDNGIGIEARHLEKIWNIFYQVNPKSPDTGDGIGLSVVKRIVDKHNGKIRVESEENRGTKFYITLQKNEFSV